MDHPTFPTANVGRVEEDSLFGAWQQDSPDLAVDATTTPPIAIELELAVFLAVNEVTGLGDENTSDRQGYLAMRMVGWSLLGFQHADRAGNVIPNGYF